MKRSPALRKWHWQVKTSTYMRHWPLMSWGWQNNFDWYQHPFSLAEPILRMIHVSYARGYCTIFIWFCFKFLLYPIHRISSLIIFKVATLAQMPYSLQWRHNERDGVSIHQPHLSVYSSVYSGADQRKHQSSTSLAFVYGIHRDRWIPRTKGQ